ncbi:MAG: SapC family protein [Campylobacter sp.]|uniref:SapC family protein n=1 Tax=Campylobacter sp. VBCF_01 NA2 TaxID=2983836 RepID=UPI001B634A5A|nr:SapC family protein [Campylobacter sp. VBCF_01 NA2]MBP3224981.1 SapC family protein [Campylobacter sp.]WBR54386.1 SapC family protein [Campylobacter sp. VBCF_01 NA2]
MRPVILDSVKHADLKYHADAIPNEPFVPVIAPEVPACSDKLVIVFTNEPEPKMVALLGRSKNLLIDKSYKGMVPSAIQNYPFFLAKIEDRMVICFDEDAKQIKGEGEALFEEGKPTQFLENLKSVMKNYWELNAITSEAAKELKEAGVLEAKELNIQKDGETITLLNGFLILNREKLLSLDDKKLAEFARKGYLELAFFHLKSLSNLQTLGDKIMAKDAPKSN